MGNFIDIGPECFADPQQNIICYQGENYYRACGEAVHQFGGGGLSTCVRRFGHAGDLHEDYDGRIRNAAEELDLKLGDKPLEQAVFETLGAVSTCWSGIQAAGIFDSTRAKNYGDQLMRRIREAGPIYG
jgi:hypothetical protein